MAVKKIYQKMPDVIKIKRFQRDNFLHKLG